MTRKDLKPSDQLEITGITTASSIWLAAALSTATGMRLCDLALAGGLASLTILVPLRPLEKRLP